MKFPVLINDEDLGIMLYQKINYEEDIAQFSQSQKKNQLLFSLFVIFMSMIKPFFDRLLSHATIT